MAEPGSRNTTRQREAGAAARAETRRRLLAAAGEEFALHGYAGATVARIAARAGVTVQTLYLAWGSKVALLQAHLQAALVGLPDGPGPRRYVDALLAQLPTAGTDPVAGIAQIAALYGDAARRAAPTWKLYRDAAATDPEVARDWHRLQVLRRGTFRRLLERLPAGALRPGLTFDGAVDTAWAIASPDTYLLLVTHRGFSPSRYERWVRDTLVVALLDPGAIAGSDGAASPRRTRRGTGH